MDAKPFKFNILNASIATRIVLRSLLLVCAISILSLFRAQSLFQFPPITTYLDCVSGFQTLTFGPTSHLIRTTFWPTFNCHKDANLTFAVVTQLTGNQLLHPGAKSLCLGQGSSIAVTAMKQLGFSSVSSLPTLNKHLYEDSSLDFVLSRDLDRVPVPALLVLEVERVLKPGGVGALLVPATTPHPNSNDLIRAATPVSSLLRYSNVVHVSSVHDLNLVVFKKQFPNASSFYHHTLPADCPSLTFTKPLIQLMEPLLTHIHKPPPPLHFHTDIHYLPKFLDLSTRKRLVYIDIGAGELLNANATDWFLPSYPIHQTDFNAYFVHYNTSILLSYVKRPGVTFVYHPGLAAIGKPTVKLDDDLDPFVGEEDFDFLSWFKETVQYADFVVLKMNAGTVELKFLSDIFENGAICFVDELFLKCPDTGGHQKTVTSEENCMDLYKGLRSNGVYVHQCWGD
ncbi:hypothetical protein VNO78_17657 [Psophocarpus tetragonolobus]|uniref:DUF7870 domain-containing protein n=1 Tax=Psophocarpus tetragonolobus TaxID=3891 RepID=A0AAN9SMZ8_PSOTE